MSLKHAMLGLLSIHSMNGYQIKKYFDEGIKHFWNVSISQIYPTLGSMLQSRLIKIENDGDGTARPSKIYAITEKGREELLQWISTPSKEDPFRSEMLLKLYFSSPLESKTLIRHFEQIRKQTQAQVDLFESKLKHLNSCHADQQNFETDAVYWGMTARYGILRDMAQIDWCDECIRILKGREQNGDSVGKGEKR